MTSNRQPTPALLVTAAIVLRGAERHGACATPQSGCYEPLKRRRMARWTSLALVHPTGFLVPAGRSFEQFGKTRYPIRRGALTRDTAPAVSRIAWRSAPRLDSATR
jgi:hypothetical protein